VLDLRVALHGQTLTLFCRPTPLAYSVAVYAFYGAALNAGQSSQEKAVRPTVCLSVYQMRPL